MPKPLFGLEDTEGRALGVMDPCPVSVTPVLTVTLMLERDFLISEIP